MPQNSPVSTTPGTACSAASAPRGSPIRRSDRSRMRLPAVGDEAARRPASAARCRGPARPRAAQHLLDRRPRRASPKGTTSTGSGKAPSAVDLLGRVGDDDHPVASRGDDLLLQKRAAAALDQVQRRIELVRAVDGQVEPAAPSRSASGMPSARASRPRPRMWARRSAAAPSRTRGRARAPVRRGGPGAQPTPMPSSTKSQARIGGGAFGGVIASSVIGALIRGILVPICGAVGEGSDAGAARFPRRPSRRSARDARLGRGPAGVAASADSAPRQRLRCPAPRQQHQHPRAVEPQTHRPSRPRWRCRCVRPVQSRSRRSASAAPRIGRSPAPSETARRACRRPGPDPPRTRAEKTTSCGANQNAPAAATAPAPPSPPTHGRAARRENRPPTISGASTARSTLSKSVVSCSEIAVDAGAETRPRRRRDRVRDHPPPRPDRHRPPEPRRRRYRRRPRSARSRAPPRDPRRAPPPRRRKSQAPAISGRRCRRAASPRRPAERLATGPAPASTGAHSSPSRAPGSGRPIPRNSRRSGSAQITPSTT